MIRILLTNISVFLNGSGLSAAYIKLELTESAFFENISIMNNVIEALHKSWHQSLDG